MREQHGDSPMTTPTTDAQEALATARKALLDALNANSYRGRWSTDEPHMLPMRWDADDAVQRVIDHLAAAGWTVAREQPAAPHVARMAALEKGITTVRTSLQREYDGTTGGDRPPYYANGILYAIHVIDRYVGALKTLESAALATPEPPRSEEPTCVRWEPGVVPCGKTEEEHPKRGHRFIAAFTTPAPGGRDE